MLAVTSWALSLSSVRSIEARPAESVSRT
jgi:hypothetical protein